MNNGDLEIEFLFEPDEWDHDFGLGLDAFLDCIGGCFKQGINGRISDTVKKADELLYRAKIVKNRVVCEKTD